MSPKNETEKERQEAIRYFVWVAGVTAAVIIFFIGYVHANFLPITVANERKILRDEQHSTTTSEIKGVKKEFQTFRIWAVQNWGKKNPSPYPAGEQ